MKYFQLEQTYFRLLDNLTADIGSKNMKRMAI